MGDEMDMEYQLSQLVGSTKKLLFKRVFWRSLSSHCRYLDCFMIIIMTTGLLLLFVCLFFSWCPIPLQMWWWSQILLKALCIRIVRMGWRDQQVNHPIKASSPGKPPTRQYWDLLGRVSHQKLHGSELVCLLFQLHTSSASFQHISPWMPLFTEGYQKQTPNWIRSVAEPLDPEALEWWRAVAIVWGTTWFLARGQSWEDSTVQIDSFLVSSNLAMENFSTPMNMLEVSQCQVACFFARP